MTPTIIPATDSAIEALRSFLARVAFDSALLLAATAQTYTELGTAGACAIYVALSTTVQQSIVQQTTKS